ncbi:MAG: ABC transporter permease [Candidatus Palauibacterales bacterium]|nr:ABC transporter permease [Candidatus Palauibacterales bacterium]
MTLVEAYVKRAVLGVQEYFILTVKAVRYIGSRPFYWRDTIQQMDVIGVGSLGIVLLTGLFTGMVLALQSSIEMKRFGASIYIGRLVGASAVRELGPVLTALMVAGRVGSGMAAQLGSMKVTEQIDALNVIGTDPIKKLVTPRLVAALIMLPLLTVITDIVAIFGGMMIATIKLDLTTDLYMRSVYETLAGSGFVFGVVPKDVLGGLIKPFFFGGIIAMTGCYFGLQTRGGTEGVGVSTTRAVVTASILILAVDYFLTQLMITFLFD